MSSDESTREKPANLSLTVVNAKTEPKTLNEFEIQNPSQGVPGIGENNDAPGSSDYFPQYPPDQAGIHDSEIYSNYSSDVIYEGGLENKEDIEYKVFDGNDALLQPDGNDVEINVQGVKYKIPFAIECHLCNEMMNLCLRRTRYRGKPRDYPAYRCNRKGCQTFRSIRKVFSNCVNDPSSSEDSTPKMVYQPPEISKDEKDGSPKHGEFSEDESEEFIVQKVNLPKANRRIYTNSCGKPASVTEKMKKANQERANVFNEFADQLRRDIAANKRIKTKKQFTEEEEHQGTLFYISKELNPQEIIELQDAIIKQLIVLRKLPPPMTMYDLPLFANCPYSKKELEAGLAKSQDDFWTAFTNSPQPPLPAGFIRKKDDTLIYIDPKPYEVPEILQENSPEKQAEDVISYHKRKGEQDARRMERRQVEKKFRSWVSLKREFDMAECEDFPSPKTSRTFYGDVPTSSTHPSHPSRNVTLVELMNKMGAKSTGQSSFKIRAGGSETPCDSMKWIESKKSQELQGIDSASQKDNSEECQQKNFEAGKNFKQQSLMHSMMRTLSSPTARFPISPLLKPFSSFDSTMRPPPMFFGETHFNINSPSFYSLNPYFQQYSGQTPTDPHPSYPARDQADEHYNNVGASEVVISEPPFTYIHPESGVRFTDPSAYLTTFVPSPITKMPPISFSDETTRQRRSSEPSTSTSFVPTTLSDSCGNDNEGEEKKVIDDILKFDPPIMAE